MEERKTLCKEEFNNCEIVKENIQLNDKLKNIEEYINKNNVYKYNEKGICIESPYIDWQCISRDILKIIKGGKE